MFERRGKDGRDTPVTNAVWNERPSERRARTSWMAPALVPDASTNASNANKVNVALRPNPPPAFRPEELGAPLEGDDEIPQIPDSTGEGAGADAHADLGRAAPAPREFRHASVIPPAQNEPDPTLLAEVAAAIENAATARARALRGAERQLVALAGVVARRVVGREITVDPSIVAALASEGLDALAERDRVTVRLGVAFGDEAVREIQRRITQRGVKCEIVRDPACGALGCVVETEHGRVDESIDARLGNVLDALTGGRAVPDDEAHGAHGEGGDGGAR